MTKNSKSFKALEIKSQSKAVEEANEKIRFHKDEEHPGLLSEWSRVNDAMGGFWRFGEIIFLAGASGSGKSYILNTLRKNFTSELNQDYPRPFKILSFSLEMSAADEMIRSYSANLQKSYIELLSGKEKLTDDYYNKVVDQSEELKNDQIWYVEDSGNREEIYNTVEKFNNRFPEHQLVITVDHTLLMEYLDEAGEVALVTSLSMLAKTLKKRFGAMVILLGQLNDKIENEHRRDPDKPHLHQPQKQDIHGSKAVYMIADTVVVIHRPELLEITNYKGKYDTTDKIFWHFLKGRFTGSTGLVPMTQQFEKGKLLEDPKEESQKQLKLTQ